MLIPNHVLKRIQDSLAEWDKLWELYIPTVWFKKPKDNTDIMFHAARRNDEAYDASRKNAVGLLTDEHYTKGFDADHVICSLWKMYTPIMFTWRMSESEPRLKCIKDKFGVVQSQYL